jgi:hypothetical protein
MGRLGGDEAKRRRDRSGGRAAFQQPRDEQDGQVGGQPGHEHRHAAEDGAQEHDDLAAVAVGQDAEYDGPGQLGGVEAARQQGVGRWACMAADGQVVDQIVEQPPGDGRAHTQQERSHEHGDDGPVHRPIA